MNNTARTRLLALAVAAVALVAPSVASAAPVVSNVGIATANTQFTGVLDVTDDAKPRVVQNGVTMGAGQRWNLVATSVQDRVQVVNLKSGMCLTTSGVAGDQLYLTYCNDANPRQVWAGGIQKYDFFSSGNLYNPATGLSVDVQGSSGAPRTPVIGWYGNGGRNQRFAYWFWN